MACQPARLPVHLPAEPSSVLCPSLNPGSWARRSSLLFLPSSSSSSTLTVPQRAPGRFACSQTGIHPPTCLWSWRAAELRSQVRWWQAQDLGRVQGQLGLHVTHKPILCVSSLFRWSWIDHWGVSPCGFPVYIRAVNSRWISNLIRGVHSFQCAEIAVA